MPSSLWFYGMIVVGGGVFYYTAYKKRNIADLVSFFLAATGLSFTGEYIILFLLNSYLYKPGIFADFYADNIIGHNISNISLWSTTAIMVGAFSLRHRWILLISVILTLLDILYVRLGLYEHHWWRSYMTCIASLIFFSIIKIWFAKLKEKPYGLLRNITFFFIALVVIHVPSLYFLFSEKQVYILDWYKEMFRNGGVFSVAYHAGIAILYVLFVCILKKWYWRLVPILIVLISDTILLKTSIVILQHGMNLFYLTLASIISLVIFILLEKHTYRQTAIEKKPHRLQ